MSRVITMLLAFACLSLIGWLAWSYATALSDLADKKQALIVWETKYTAAVDAQKESEKTIAQLQQSYSSLLSEVEEWRMQYEAIDRENTDAQRRIRKLEAQNAEIRDILRSRVPDDVWRVLFPKPRAAGDAGGDQGGKAGGSRSLSHAVR